MRSPMLGNQSEVCVLNKEFPFTLILIGTSILFWGSPRLGLPRGTQLLCWRKIEEKLDFSVSLGITQHLHWFCTIKKLQGNFFHVSYFWGRHFHNTGGPTIESPPGLLEQNHPSLIISFAQYGCSGWHCQSHLCAWGWTRGGCHQSPARWWQRWVGTTCGNYVWSASASPVKSRMAQIASRASIQLPQRSWQCPAPPHTRCMARDQWDSVEVQNEREPNISINSFSLMYKQVAYKGKFSQEPKEDNRLKHCWGQVQMVEGEDQ